MLAAEVGLAAEQADGLGFSATTVTPAAAAVYAPAQEQLAGGAGRPPVPLHSRIRVSATVLGIAPITSAA